MKKFSKTLTKEDLLEMYRLMCLSRRNEEAMVEIHKRTPLPELPHVGIGQEAIMIGTSYLLKEGDMTMPSHRDRGVFYVMGMSSKEMMAGAYGKDIPSTRGKISPHHIGITEQGLVTGSGVIGSQIPVMTGVALAMKYKKTDNVAIVYFGDGAINRGDFHESINLAAVLDLPIVFICENNLYAISMEVGESSRVKDLAIRAEGYGIEGIIADGMDVLAMYDVTQHAIEKARSGRGPTLIECKTYRFRAHSERDPRDLRPKEEIEAWVQKCPIQGLKKKILEEKIASAEDLSLIETAVNQEVEDAISYSEQAEFPAPELVYTNVYAE